MLKNVKTAWDIETVRKKLLIMLLILVVFRLGNAITVPFINYETLQQTSAMTQGLFGIFNLMSGGAFAMATLFALGVQPYINASIIIELLCIAIPSLGELQKEGGEIGKKKVKYITYALTGALAILQAVGYYLLMRRYTIITKTGFGPALLICFLLVLGAAAVTALGELGTKKGIGNGISFILLVGILSRVPNGIANIISGTSTWLGMRNISVETLTEQGISEEAARNYLSSGTAPWETALIIVGVIALTLFIIYVQGAERRIPIQYAKRNVGNKLYGGQSTFLPIKVAMAGVLPIIFAQSLLGIPSTVFAFPGDPAKGTFFYPLYSMVTNRNAVYIVLYLVLLVLMTYFQVYTQVDPIELSNRLRNNGAMVPGYRPGKPTTELLKYNIDRVAFIGAVYIAVIAILPILADHFTMQSLAIGGTSLIITVSVILELHEAIKTQNQMNSYRGFMK